MRITRSIRSLLFAACRAGNIRGVRLLKWDRHIGQFRSTCASRVRAASMPCRGLYLDARLLGLRPATVITGCRAHGCWLRKSVSSGPRDGGDGAATRLFSMKATGVRTSASTAGSITDSATSANGYEGGRWDNGRFFYNRSVNNVNVTNIHNVYNTTVINNTTVNRVSYNGGNGGINARPTPEQEAAEQ